MSDVSQDADQMFVERAHFRGELAMTAQRPEFIRAELMRVHLRSILHSPYLTREECFAEVYGEEGEEAFWKFEFSEPTMKVERFLDLLTVNIARAENEFSALMAALSAAVLIAFRADNAWFTGNIAVLENAQYGGDIQRPDITIYSRNVAEWLLEMPKKRHLVPDSLASFLRGPGMVTQDPVATVASGAPAEVTPAPVRKRGRPNTAYLVFPELERRAAAGVLAETNAAESRYLVAWLKTAHPLAEPLTKVTIENSIRHRYKELSRDPTK